MPLLAGLPGRRSDPGIALGDIGREGLRLEVLDAKRTVAFVPDRIVPEVEPVNMDRGPSVRKPSPTIGPKAAIGRGITPAPGRAPGPHYATGRGVKLAFGGKPLQGVNR